MERPTGLEPAAACLGSRNSTVELRSRGCAQSHPCWARASSFRVEVNLARKRQTLFVQTAIFQKGRVASPMAHSQPCKLCMKKQGTVANRSHTVWAKSMDAPFSIFLYEILGCQRAQRGQGHQRCRPLLLRQSVCNSRPAKAPVSSICLACLAHQAKGYPGTSVQRKRKGEGG